MKLPGGRGCSPPFLETWVVSNAIVTDIK